MYTPCFLLVLVSCTGLAALPGDGPGYGRGQRCVGVPPPQIRGLHLGMTLDELRQAFVGGAADPQARADFARAADPYGVSGFTLYPGRYPNKDRFANISELRVRLVDHRVASLDAIYSNVEWENVDQFISKLSESLGLPAAEAWAPAAGQDGQMKFLECEGFRVRAFAPAGCCSSLMILDTAAERLVEERKREEKEKARREFKP
jgi:hypothetical protein